MLPLTQRAASQTIAVFRLRLGLHIRRVQLLVLQPSAGAGHDTSAHAEGLLAERMAWADPRHENVIAPIFHACLTTRLVASRWFCPSGVRVVAVFLETTSVDMAITAAPQVLLLSRCGE